MRQISALKYALREARLPALFACLFAYLAYHLVQGEYGLLAWKQLQVNLQHLQTQVAELHQQRADLENQVVLMRSDGLDPDMLDEQARRVLGYVDSKDVLILSGESDD